MTYCPTLFVTHEDDKEILNYSLILKNYKSQEAGLIIVGDADKYLNIKHETLLHYHITPACVKRILIVSFEI